MLTVPILSLSAAAFLGGATVELPFDLCLEPESAVFASRLAAIPMITIDTSTSSAVRSFFERGSREGIAIPANHFAHVVFGIEEGNCPWPYANSSIA